MSKIVIVCNRKGGVGKTTWTIHIAAGLAQKGRRVGLVDTDSQGHAGLMLNMPESDGLFQVLIEKAPLEECVLSMPTGNGSLHLLPSSARTYKIPYMLNPDESFLFLQKMEEFAALCSLDVILVDTAPTMSLFDGAIYLAADGYIYVTEPERLSLDGVMVAVDQMQRFSAQRRQYLNRESSILGIIPNKVRQTLVHRRNIEALRDHFGDLVWQPVTLRTMWAEASNLNQTIYDYAPNGPEAEDATRIVGAVENALWQTEKQS